MSSFVGLGAILLVAVVTPGPNNLIVMTEAARSGWRGALRAGIAIVAGSVALLFLVFAGLGSVLAESPKLATAISLVGCLYLTWLGAKLIATGLQHGTGTSDGERAARISGAGGPFAFQFLNPKAWVTTITAVSVAQASFGPRSALVLLLTLMLAVSIPSLTLWSSCGVALRERMRHRPFRAWFEGGAGGLLVTSALLLMAQIACGELGLP